MKTLYLNTDQEEPDPRPEIALTAGEILAIGYLFSAGIKSLEKESDLPIKKVLLDNCRDLQHRFFKYIQLD